MKVRLAIREGGQVAAVIIPPFQKLPGVLVWGQRFFAFHRELTEPEEPYAAGYREVLVFFVPPEPAQKPVGG